MKRKLFFSAVALLFCSLSMFAAKPVNVTKKYMENFTDPYRYVGMFTEEGDTNTVFTEDQLMGNGGESQIIVNGESVTVPRFHRLAGPWKLEGELALGEVNDIDGNPTLLATGWHVDMQKASPSKRKANIKGALTITVGWDNLAPTIDNAKVYQKLKSELPAGKYTFGAAYAQDASGAKGTFLVITKGESLPDTAALVANEDANVLAYVRLSDSTHVALDLAKAENLTVGLVACLSDKQCSAMGDFSIVYNAEGLTDYTVLERAVKNAETKTEETYPIGVTAGNYTKEAWDAFVAARTAAKAIVDGQATGDPLEAGYKDNHTQEQVDAALKVLVDAYDALNASFIVPFFYSTAEKEWWYNVIDRRANSSAWSVTDDLLGDEYVSRLNYVSKATLDEDAANEQYQFKFVKNEEKAGSFFIYNKQKPDVALSVSKTANNFIQVIEGVDTAWSVAAVPNPRTVKDYFRVYLSGKIDRQLNSFGGSTAGGHVGFWNPGNGQDPGNDWKFKRVLGDGETNFDKLKDEYAKAFKVTEEAFPLGTAAGQYDAEMWSAFVGARDAAKALIAKEMDLENQPSQADVDLAVENLIYTYNQLSNSMVPPMEFSKLETENSVWYLLKDKRSNPSYWYFDKDQYTLSLKTVSEVEDINDPGLHFKFVKPADRQDEKAFLIYTEADPEHALVFYPDDTSNTIQIGDEGTDTCTWLAGRTPALDKEYYTLRHEATGKQLNSDVSNEKVWFWTPTEDDPGNDWKFINAANTGVKNLSSVELGVFVRGKKVFSRNSNDVINVYSISGQKLNSNLQLLPGIYIVTVDGKEGAAKIMVR